MVFVCDGKEYVGATSVEVVREMERDAVAYPHRGGSLRAFLRWSLAGLADRVHMRELDIGAHLTDETLAFGYLCLLDQHGIGRLDDAPPTNPPLGKNTHAA
ncbi:MAG TPA: hypothetical protein VK422_08565 [Pyrinomonadaceae bacterium]|nr:hypothetical protein [Pyrinomonadaceae bacterium]